MEVHNFFLHSAKSSIANLTLKAKEIVIFWPFMALSRRVLGSSLMTSPLQVNTQTSWVDWDNANKGPGQKHIKKTMQRFELKTFGLSSYKFKPIRRLGHEHCYNRPRKPCFYFFFLMCICTPIIEYWFSSMFLCVSPFIDMCLLSGQCWPEGTVDSNKIVRLHCKEMPIQVLISSFSH